MKMQVINGNSKRVSGPRILAGPELKLKLNALIIKRNWNKLLEFELLFWDGGLSIRKPKIIGNMQFVFLDKGSR